MSKMIAKVFTVVIVFLMLIEFGMALKCYKCSAVADKGDACDDPADTSKLKQEECLKSVSMECAKYKFEILGAKSIQRDCVIAINGTCKQVKVNLDKMGAKLLQCSACAKDLCNMGNIAAVSGKVLLILLTAVVHV